MAVSLGGTLATSGPGDRLDAPGQRHHAGAPATGFSESGGYPGTIKHTGGQAHA